MKALLQSSFFKLAAVVCGIGAVAYMFGMCRFA
jgi:hypothetical protein